MALRQSHEKKELLHAVLMFSNIDFQPHLVRSVPRCQAAQRSSINSVNVHPKWSYPTQAP